jgi:hypothetical protein
MSFCPKFLDYYHHVESFPLTSKSNKSCCGITITILMIVSLIIIIIIDSKYYNEKFTVTYSKRYGEDIKNNITLGFNVLSNKIDIEITDCYGEKVIPKTYDRFLNIVNDDVDTSTNLYQKCLVNFSLDTNNHIPKHKYALKFDIIVKNTQVINEEIVFILSTRRPWVRHEFDDPLFLESLPISSFYEMDPNYYTTYQKYLKKIKYFIEKDFSTTEYNDVFLDDYNEITKINSVNKTIIGSFIIKKSEQIDEYKKIFFGIFEVFSLIGGHFSLVNIAFSMLSLIFVNPNDNLRIFDSMRKNNPSILEPTKTAINNYWQKEQKGNKITEKIKGISCGDKWAYFFGYYFCKWNKYSKTSENEHLYAIDKYIEDKLIIENYLENNIINENKNIKLKESLMSLSNNNEFKRRQIEKNNQNTPIRKQEIENGQRNYLENLFFENYNFNDIESEEIRMKIKLIINEIINEWNKIPPENIKLEPEPAQVNVINNT